MKKRLIKSMISVLIIQVALFGVAIVGGKTIQALSNEYLTILDSHVVSQKDYIEDEMLQYWSNITGFETYIQTEFEELEVGEDLSRIPELLETVIDRTVVALRQSGVTEIFIILEGEKNHEGIYLRDLDPLYNAIDDSDILMERGPVDIARKINIPLDTQWASKFTLSEKEQDSEFYYKPFLAAHTYPKMSPRDLGYWSKPFRLSPNDIEIITYSIPLVDKWGKPYGVVGVGLTVDYLRGILDYDKLAKNKRGAYLLSINNSQTGDFEEVVSSGPMYNRLIETHSGEVYATVQHLNLYNSNTPFENDRWSLTGFVEKRDLLAPIRQIIKSILISLVVSLFLGILSVYIVGTWFMKPINNLMNKVLKSNPSNPFIGTKTNILEIDELGLAIESLNNKVIDSSTKLSQIISMVNLPIGAFEYDFKEDKVFYTDTLFDIVGMKKDNNDSYVSLYYFKKIIRNIKKEPEIDLENIYRYEKDDGKTCWLRMTTKTRQEKMLGVIEDVTQDVIWRRKAEYERDHDILTHLLNRRAFEVLVRKKMKDEFLDHCGFVMWDLDNLKYINDTYGHDHGDRYIQRAASILNEFTIYNAIVARMSGDEFYTFIYGYKTKDEIRKRVKEMQTSLYHTFLTMPDEETFRIRASAGIAWYPEDSKEYDELVKYSDFTMYEIKNKDKGNIGEFNRANYEKDSILLHGKEELNHFIDKGLVKYAFQPIVDTKTGNVYAYEALMRPQTKKLSSPLDVIRLAQSQSKLYEIEKLTWFQAMECFEAQKEHFGDAKIFINSIPSYVLSKQDLEMFEKRFSKHLSRIVIEITENEQSHEECTKIKQETVARWGSHLALDDFGSGYNSEVALLVLSPKFIKIDMTIVTGIDRDENRQKLLSNILSYAKIRDIKIIAEGIETKAEADKLIEFGVDYMQGYYLGKPQIVPEQINPKIKSFLIKANTEKEMRRK